MLSLWALLLARRQSLPTAWTQALVPCKLRLVLLARQLASLPQKRRPPQMLRPRGPCQRPLLQQRLK